MRLPPLTEEFMSLPPTWPATDHFAATQESMFEEEAGASALEPYEAADEAFEESPFEGAPEFAEDFSRSTAPRPGAAYEATHESEIHDEPALQPAVPSAPAHAENVLAAPVTVLTIDDFSALEERILRAVSLVRSERQARAAAEQRVAALEAQLKAANPAVERLQQEVDSLRIEREQVRQRVERLLAQLDAMEL